MKATNMAKLLIFWLLVLLALALKSKAGDIVIYWGQNKNEGRITDTCKSGNYKIVNIAFLSVFGGGKTPRLNLAGHCNPAANGCQILSEGINNCQNLGVKVLLSIGGGTGSYSITSAEDGRSVADYIWNNFLGGTSNSRPLGDAILDGVDFDIEGGEPHYVTLARTLSERIRESGKQFYLTAAPQCLFPDNYLDKALRAVHFDYVWIQFYNNPPCEYKPSNPQGFQDAWNQWTTNIPAKKFFVGLPASEGAAENGYVRSDVLKSEVLPFVKGSPNYGGVMLWDRYHDRRFQYSREIIGSV